MKGRRVAAARPEPELVLDLEQLLDPCSVADFVDNWWDRRVLTSHRGQADYYDRLLRLADIDALLAFSAPHADDRLLFAGAGEGLATRHTARDRAYLYDAWRQGRTLNLNSVQLRWEPLANTCASLEAFFTCPVSANLYLTPPGAKGLAPHFDGHNVFILQIAGRKRWRIFSGGADRPLLGDDGVVGALGTVDHEVTLEAGDFAYIPRGRAHEAWTEDRESLHVTIGVRAWSRADLLQASVRACARRDAALRELLPIGFARSDIDNDLSMGLEACDLRADEGARLLAREWLEHAAPRTTDRFAQLGRLPALDAETWLERTGLCLLHEEAGRPVLRFAGNFVAGSPHLRSSFAHIVAHPRLRPRDLPLEEADALVLIRRLVREGLLRVEGTPAGPTASP